MTPQLAFKHRITVQPSDIDGLNHVNNLVYLKWMIETAVAHSKSLGYDLEKFKSLGGMFVVRRHEIDYLAPTFLGDEITAHTWLSSMSGKTCYREYEMVRASDSKVVSRGKTLWFFINLEGKPVTMPEQIVRDYGPFIVPSISRS